MLLSEFAISDLINQIIGNWEIGKFEFVFLNINLES